MRLHASAVARLTAAGWRAVVIRGPSGAGKSDLCLRLVGRGWILAGDDQLEAWRSGNDLYVAPAAPIAGRIEARAVGVLPSRFRAPVRAGLIVDLAREEPERLPEPAHVEIAEVSLPVLVLRGLDASAPEKIAWALAGRVG